MSDLVMRLRAWHKLGETITGDVALHLGAADRIAALETALVELSLTNGSPRNVANTEMLASRVHAAAHRAPREPTDDKINEAFNRVTGV